MINKGLFLQLLAKKAKLTQKDAEAFLNAYHELIAETLKAKDSVRFAGFGSYSCVLRKARVNKNPATGERVDTPAHYALAFKFGEPLKKAVKEANPIEEVKAKASKSRAKKKK